MIEVRNALRCYDAEKENNTKMKNNNKCSVLISEHSYQSLNKYQSSYIYESQCHK